MQLLHRLFLPVVIFMYCISYAQESVPQKYQGTAETIVREALTSNQSYEMLANLLAATGHRLSGSPGAAKAVEWTKATMEQLGFDKVWLEPVTVPHWVRGSTESASVLAAGKRTAIPLRVTALGGSIGTPEGGITAEVVEVKSFDELRSLGEKAKGKIVFFNRPMDRAYLHTFEAYGRAVNQRGAGAIEAARAGGVAALVRSMTTRIDDSPHTGAMWYRDTITKVPSAAVSTRDAERLSAFLEKEPHLKVNLRLSCSTLPDVESANVIGQLTGSEYPNEVIVIGGHLDSWDLGVGAHDDGSGCVQSIEALRILKKLGLKPKRTIRAVMFMNEENGLRGGRAYAAVERPGERHIAAIESDEGGFTPRGFGIGDSLAYSAISQWAPLFEFMDASQIRFGGGGADISPLARKGVPPIGLMVDPHRYFDVHHSENDILENVNERELALGAGAMAILAYVIAEEGLPAPRRDSSTAH